MESIQIIWEFIINWYWIPLTLVNIGAFITILIENGKPEKTIAWLMVIVFIPIIGVILYYFFGQKFKKEKYFKRLDEKYETKLKEKWIKLKSYIEQQIQLTATYDEHLNDAFEYLAFTKNSIPTSNNAVDLFINGEEKFPNLIRDIQSAQHHIHLEYYIFEEDNIGKELLNLLIEKAKQKVIVRIIIDDFGSSKLAKRKTYYESLGLQFEIFLPVKFTSLANSNYRNHRKIVVIDGKIGYVGGINISDKYINTTSSTLYWKDTAVRIEGDAVKILQMQFWLHWQSISERSFLVVNEYLPTLEAKEKQHPVTFAFSSPGNSPAYVMESMILSILSAQKSVWLCTPYFIPTEAFKTALLIAISKGVDVQLMIPKIGDSSVVQAATLSFLKPFVERGMKVHLYTKGFIHAKTICIDDLLSYVGTTNLDSRSFLINFELSALILDSNLASKLNDSFKNDLKTTIPFTSEIWKNEKWYYKTFASICRLLAPLL